MKQFCNLPIVQGSMIKHVPHGGSKHNFGKRGPNSKVAGLYSCSEANVE